MGGEDRIEESEILGSTTTTWSSDDGGEEVGFDPESRSSLSGSSSSQSPRPVSQPQSQDKHNFEVYSQQQLQANGAGGGKEEALAVVDAAEIPLDEERVFMDSMSPILSMLTNAHRQDAEEEEDDVIEKNEADEKDHRAEEERNDDIEDEGRNGGDADEEEDEDGDDDDDDDDDDNAIPCSIVATPRVANELFRNQRLPRFGEGGKEQEHDELEEIAASVQQLQRAIELNNNNFKQRSELINPRNGGEEEAEEEKKRADGEASGEYTRPTLMLIATRNSAHQQQCSDELQEIQRQVDDLISKEINREEEEPEEEQEEEEEEEEEASGSSPILTMMSPPHQEPQQQQQQDDQKQQQSSSHSSSSPANHLHPPPSSSSSSGHQSCSIMSSFSSPSPRCPTPSEEEVNNYLKQEQENSSVSYDLFVIPSTLFKSNPPIHSMIKNLLQANNTNLKVFKGIPESYTRIAVKRDASNVACCDSSQRCHCHLTFSILYSSSSNESSNHSSLRAEVKPFSLALQPFS